MALKARVKPCIVKHLIGFKFLNEIIEKYHGEYFPVFVPMKYDNEWYSPLSVHEENITRCFHKNELIIKEFKDEEI